MPDYPSEVLILRVTRLVSLDSILAIPKYPCLALLVAILSVLSLLWRISTFRLDCSTKLYTGN